MQPRLVPFLCLLLNVGVGPTVYAQHGHGQEHEHGKPVEFVMPNDYKAAVKEIRSRLHEISEMIGSRQLAGVHAQADVIMKVGNVIGQLALKEGSGVPKEAVRDVNIAGRGLAGKFDAIDRTGDSGDVAGTKRIYDEMVELTQTLRKYVPMEYACPMRCEGDKTYPTAEKCSKCGMKLQDVESHLDHEPKHGGVFFMTQDQLHHLEGTLSTTSEFRIYFYDEYTKPIAADKFTAEGKAWTQKSKLWMDGADQAKPITLRPGPDRAYLTGQLDGSLRFPIGVKMAIDFKDGAKPSAFDFEFSEPSKEPSSSGHDARREPMHKDHQAGHDDE